MTPAGGQGEDAPLLVVCRRVACPVHVLRQTCFLVHLLISVKFSIVFAKILSQLKVFQCGRMPALGYRYDVVHCRAERVRASQCLIDRGAAYSTHLLGF